ncbi:unnamed protein product [Ostreobium quekettii]|uniref:RING-type domain-containing protein n=1 Tax=Ostreobium quekettii TaxID=121088 RepID=A0A8S1J9I1_9CHLO|nr:unnamed protein product [Ostreobium quekettii]
MASGPRRLARWVADDAGEGRCPEGWQCASLRCDHLREILNGVGEDEFFQALEEEVERLSRQFETSAESIIAACDTLRWGSKMWNPFNKRKAEISVCTWPTNTKATVGTRNICVYARAAIKFAKDNAVAVRLLTEEHHKLHANERGQEYLRGLWQDKSGKASFLHSPLLAELAAVELAWAANKSCTTPHERLCNSSRDGVSRNSDFQCPICLDTLFRPLALGCGHVFCQSCLFDAFGCGRRLGTAGNMLSCIPASARCPECRSDNVAAGAKHLKVLSTTLQQRFPEYWQTREQEEKESLTSLHVRNVQLRLHKMRQALTQRAKFHPSMLMI